MSSTRWFFLSEESLAQSIQICLPINIMLSSIIGALTHRIRLWVASRGQIYPWQQRKELVHETISMRRAVGSMKETEKSGNKGAIYEHSRQDLKGNGCPDYLED